MQKKEKTTLTNEEISRYSRQLLLPCIGTAGQEKILKSSVLVVGAGGLGSPVLLYLAAAGIGKLGIIDYDNLETSNLQRQIVHSEKNVGTPKVESAKSTIQNLNSNTKVETYNLLIDKSNAMDIIKEYDIVVDATDNVATRYLLNDASVFLKKPLVSAGALRMDGQLTVYNYNGGPCYRCIFPTPPPADTVTNCNDGGVLGVITGIMGSIQALEVLKIVTGIESSYVQKMLLFDGLTGSFRQIKIRPRNPNCPVCGDHPTITELIDYVQFCGAGAHDKTPNLKILDDKDRITVHDYKSIRDTEQHHVLLDVRETVQFNICSLDNSLHIPYANLHKQLDILKKENPNEHPVYVVCRRGNDSQLAVNFLKESGIENCFDIVGGLDEWAAKIDHGFPTY
ncbi:hypothetical protein HK103_006479 [Boothiomyces macroporosus]|uniref:Needs CLA4 to survive protein 3 n=1 Tax=Boothiomyces macroporosus TaxID=261099 RepID=A0AAD5UL50_9FUNG|nr:hypothetical protein HK103_006479 [Boothiomyces macroporosus]